jgi:hypothetical protein
MSAASEGIWFPIATDHHLHNPIIDQPADNIQATINPQTIPDKPGVNRKPRIRFPLANDHQSHDPINAQLADGTSPSSTCMKRHPPTGVLQSNPITGPRLDLRPRQTWWMDTPNWSPTGFEPVGHVIW